MIIIHRCTRCGHPEMFHHAGGSCTNCVCPRPVTEGVEPELLPTFDDSGQPVETVTEPGAAWGGGGRTCDCDRCVAFYRQQTAA